MSRITVYTARRVRTMDPGRPIAQAVAVMDGKVLSTGTLESMQPWLTRHEHVIDRTLQDKVILPGLIDPHTHFSISAGYLALEKPSVAEPVKRYGAVAPSLYQAVVNRCVEPGTVCMDQMMANDSGHGKSSVVKREEPHPGVEAPASGITGNPQSTVPSSDAPPSQTTNPMKSHHDRAH